MSTFRESVHRTLAIVFLALCAAACSSNGTMEDDDDAVVTSSEGFDLNDFPESGSFEGLDIDEFIVLESSIEFYEARLYSCANPRSSQFIGLSRNFTTKTLICVRYTVKSRARRDGMILTDIVPAINSVNNEIETAIDEFNGETTTTIVRPLYLTTDNMGSLPATLIATIKVVDELGEAIPIIAESLTTTGTVESNDPELPDGTELIVIRIPPADANSLAPNPGILTRYRDLDPAGNYCVYHDIFVNPDADTFTQSLNLTSGQLFPDETGNMKATVEIPAPTELGTYLARVFEISEGGRCSPETEQVAPAIIYQLEP